MKRYSMQYESDEIVCGENNHIYGFANTVKTAKQYIAKCRKTQSAYNPKNFRIYDHEAEVDPTTNYVPCVYQEAN